MPTVGLTLLPFPVADREAAARRLADALAEDAAHATSVLRQSRVKNMAGYLVDLDVRSMIIEYPYTDTDYLDAFAAYYAKCHTVFRGGASASTFSRPN